MANEQIPQRDHEEDVATDLSKTTDNPESPGSESTEAEPSNQAAKPLSLLDRIRARLGPVPESRDLKSAERTRGLVILVGASVACLFLFVGLFTTDADSTKKPRGTSPNLGRPSSIPANPEVAQRSAVPQLSVNQQPNEEPNELTEQDLLGTMRNRATALPPDPPSAGPSKPEPSPARDLASANFSDPALMEAYRRQNIAPPRQPSNVTNWEEAISEHQSRQQKQANAQPAAPPVKEVPQLGKSSLVFVRSQTAFTAGAQQVRPMIQRVEGRYLPQGTALIARLQHGVSSAAKAPVIAVIEYNYEDNGQILVPAGTKAYGERTGATPQGWVTLSVLCREMNLASDSIDDIPDRDTLRALVERVEEQARSKAPTAATSPASGRIAEARGRLLQAARKHADRTRKRLADVIEQGSVGTLTLEGLKDLTDANLPEVEAVIARLQ